ncbi:MAG: hypothetical protein IH877_05140 [Gemmatimonadetes bacterium]|nr:hypothetical protein [Gemmatimonadota bacterium]
MKNISRIAWTVTAILALGSCSDSGGLSAARDLTGRWEGSGNFRINCPNPAWQWNGSLVPPSVIMDLTQSGESVTGSVRFNIPASDTQLLVSGVFITGLTDNLSLSGTVTSSAATFTDSFGSTWNMTFTSDNMQGSVTSPGTNDCSRGLISVDLNGAPRASVSLGRK